MLLSASRSEAFLEGQATLHRNRISDMADYKRSPWKDEDPNASGGDMGQVYNEYAVPAQSGGGTEFGDRAAKDVYMARDTPEARGGAVGTLTGVGFGAHPVV